MFCTSCRSAVNGHFCPQCGLSAFIDKSIASAGGLNGNVFLYLERIRLSPKTSVAWYRSKLKRNVRFPLTDLEQIAYRRPSGFRKGRLEFRFQFEGKTERVAILFSKRQHRVFAMLQAAIHERCDAIAEESPKAELVA